MSRFTLGGLLVVMWVLLWGELTAANLLTGALLVALVYVVLPSEQVLWPMAKGHPLALLRLIGYMAVQMAVSNVRLASQIVSPRSRLRSDIIEVPMRTSSQTLLALIGNLLALTPGTLTVSASSEPRLLRLHVMLLHGEDEIIAVVRKLEERCVRALGTDETIAEFERAVAQRGETA